ncbi:MAG: VWA domain-containing protein [Rhodospirillaceae bacterium]|nr:VWA domain-containing protein [Rhodospirillales bacterium]
MADKLPSADKNSKVGGRAEIDAFLNKVATAPVTSPAGRGRLVFALDATASREATWRQAQSLHAEMFQAAGVGGLDVQLVYYRGMGECKAGPWSADPDKLLALLGKVACLGGETQIRKVLRHVLDETRKAKVHALVFVGDCMEEDVDQLCKLAGEMGVLGVPAFLFHEGQDPAAARTFAQIAKLSGGACCRFDASAPDQLRDLLRAVAVFATGGRKALMDYGRKQGGMVLQLTNQMGK